MPITISGSTGIAGVDGSASTPAVQGTDTNTGIFFPAADTIAFSAAGTEDFRIGSAGQLGVQGANYGTAGQVLTSGGAAAAPSWQTISTTPPQLQSQTFGSSGTWTAPTGVTKAIVTLIGGGGGNSGFTSCFSILGGVGGFLIAAVTVSPGTAYTVTIGAGGTGGAVTATGGTGGTTSFGALASATGGGGGNWSTGVTGANGTATTSGTVIRNSFAAGRGSLFDGNSYSNFTSGNQAGLAWSATSIYAAGNPGSGNFGNQGCGALGGGLMIQWVG
jgi:hypothetical protein